MQYNRKFYDAVPATGGYGYQSDDVKVSPFNFGLNPGKTFLKKFEWINNGGKDGAEQEALEIIFDINGTEKSYRKFPVVKAFNKDGAEITDPNAPEFKEALSDFNATITHILHAFIDSEDIKAGFARPINSFKEFCQIAASMLPTDFATRPLDIFLQYQWQISEGKDRTYLEIPSKMKYGRWLVPAVPGNWEEKREPNPQESTREAIWYVNENGEKHPFTKNGWFAKSNFANQQKTSSASTNTAASAAMGAGATTANAPAQTGEAKKASAW